MFTTKDDIIQLFEQIEADDHHEKVLFYQKHRAAISRFDKEKRHFFSYQYFESLFIVGKYSPLLAEIDVEIETSFLNDLKIRSVRSFEPLLFLKAKALYHTVEYDTAAELAKQLVGMAPFKKEYQQFCKAALRASLNFHASRSKLLALILIFSTSICSLAYWLKLTANDSKHGDAIILVIMTPCAIAILLLLLSFLYNQQKSKSIVNDLVKVKQRSRNKLTNDS